MSARDCTDRHIGPFVERPDIYVGTHQLLRSLGLPTEQLLPQYDCISCGSTTGFDAVEIGAVAR